jgi:hypothetical protein
MTSLKACLAHKPTPVSLKAQWLTESKWYQYLIYAAIILNTAILSIERFDHERFQTNYLRSFDSACIPPISALPEIPAAVNRSLRELRPGLDALASNDALTDAILRAHFALRQFALENVDTPSMAACATMLSTAHRLSSESSERSVVVAVVNNFLAFFFAAEFVLKAIAIGFLRIVTDPFNLFDAFVVVSSILEVIVSFLTGDKGGSVMSIFRTLRILRIIQLLRSEKKLNRLLGCLRRTCLAIAPLALMLLMVMYIFALIGIEQFPNCFALDDRSNFDSILPSRTS